MRREKPFKNGLKGQLTSSLATKREIKDALPGEPFPPGTCPLPLSDTILDTFKPD